ncbi:MAG: hypothetical protein WBP45_00705 [Daejeonella sp.]
MNCKSYILIILFAFCSFPSFAQNLDINFHGFGFVDNREYKAFIKRSTSILGNRIALDIGLNLDSVNSFRVGANAIHEFGARPFFLKVDPVIYYQYQQKGWLFNIGSFPRKDLLTDYPRAILNDTLNYYHPNTEGILTRYNSTYGHETIWIDWVSRQTDVDRENFIVGLSGKYKPKPNGPFFISHYFTLLHDAGAKIAVPNDHIRDNAGGQIRFGLDLSHKTIFDSLVVDVGGMLSLERVRGEGDFKSPKGFVANVYLGWNKFNVSDNFYIGEGHNLTYGDVFYSKKVYNRLDLSWSPFVFNNIHGKFVFSFHQSPGRLGDSQQAFFLTYNFGRREVLKL